MRRVARRVRLTGRVQGVFFRAWTKEQAEQLGVAGWVRNCPDGSVEAHAEGDEAAVEQLVQRMRVGPPHARVDHLDFEDSVAGNFSEFSVRR